MRVYVLISLVFLCFLGKSAWAQIPGNMYNPIDAGYYISSSVSYFSDNQNNSTYNGFGNNFGYQSDDVWYTITVGSTSRINISLCGSDFDTYLHLLDGNKNELESNDDNGPSCIGSQSSIQTTLSPGTYYIVAEGYSENCGNISLTIDNTDINYSIQAALATALDAGNFGSCGIRTFTDSRNNSSYNGYGNKFGQPSDDLFYRFTIGATAQVNISLCGSNFDTYLHLLNSVGTEIESNDDSGPLCTGLQSSIQTTLSPGTYYVVSEGYGTNYGDIITSIYTIMPECTDNIVPFSYSSQPVDPETRTLDTSLPVGSTAGQASVSLSGAATYSIPIFSSPGTSGMQPNISLVYSSQSGNGIAGYGWNIAGLGAITRVPHTIYHDGDVKGVNFVDDRFALDGQRLINLTPSTYGADLTSYYTEVFNGSKIVSHGNLGGAPVWFEVFNKDGSIVEYGRTDDSRFKSQLANQATVSWNINKITDANGNFIQFIYHRGDTECYIAEIKYTGNYSDSNNPLEPYNSVKFYYGNRTDKSKVFIGGSRIENNVILDHIDIRAENNLVKSYKLKYYFDFKSKLNEIEEYGKDNKRYNSTVFGYGSKEESFSNESTNFVQGQRVDIFPGDFNGDGYGDILAATYIMKDPGQNLDSVKQHTGFKIYYKEPNSNNNVFNSSSTVSLDPVGTIFYGKFLPSNQRFNPIDVNGDGRTDIIIAQTTLTTKGNKLYQLKYYISSNNPGGFDVMTRITDNDYQILAEKNNMYSGDFNGDGITDQLVLLGNDAGNFLPFVFWGGETGVCGALSIQGSFHFNTPTWKDVDKIYVEDFNGDGKSEIMLMKDANCEILAFKNDILNKYNLEEVYYGSFLTKPDMLAYGDFNGDGKIDILYRGGETYDSQWYLDIFTGTQFLESPFTFNRKPGINETGIFTSLFISDFNSDGLSDIYLEWQDSNGTGSQHDVYYSTGTSFELRQFQNNVDYSHTNPVLLDINGDGRMEFLFKDFDSNPISIQYFGKESKVNLLEKIRNGYNFDTKLSYKRLNESSTFYTRNAIAAYPINTISAPLYAVYQMNNENGVGGFSAVTYSYKDAMFHKAGKGFLGFKGITSIDPSGMIVSSSSTIDENYYFLKPDYSKTEFPAGTLLNESNSVYSFASIANAPTKVICPFPKEVINLDYISGTKIKNETNLDDFGNPEYSKISYFTNHTDTEAFGYTNTVFTNYVNAGSWCSSKPMDVESTQNRKDESNFTKKSHFDYDSKGNTTTSIEFNELLKKVTTTYTDFNKVGKPQTTTVSANSVDPRVSKIVFDDKFRYVTHTEDPEHLTSDATYDPAFGNKLTTTDANGLVTTTEYDGFGTPLQITDPLSVWSKTELKWCTSGDKPNVIFCSETTSNNGPTDRKYFDKLGRALYVSHEDFSSRNVFTKTQYNSLGLVESVSEPYFENSSPTLFTTSTYDQYNRLETVTSPSGVVLTYINPTPGQPGLKSEVSNSATGIKTSKTLDAMGKVVKASDPGGEIRYSYYSNGNPKEILAPDNSSVTMLYDEYGRQTSLSDPDAGTTGYVYNAYGELIEQTDAKGNKFTMIYDKLGRLLTKTCANDGSVTTNRYNAFNAPNAKGLINLTSYTKETSTTSFSYLYDNYSRLVQKTEHADQDYNYIYTYDTKGNLATYQFPSGFTISHTYDKGFMTGVKNNANGSSIFTPKEYTAKGQLRWWDNGAGDIIHNFNEFDQYGFPTNVLCGTNMGTWNIQNLETHFNTQTGNLEYRKDKNFMASGSYLTENFTYDNVHQNRLASWLVNGQPSSYTATYADNNGNILTKSDVTSSGNDYIYNAANKPHAVRSITNPLLTPAEVQQDITYNRFNKVEEIKHTNQGLRLNIFYGPDEQRIKSEFYINDVLTKTKHFIGGDYEVEKLPNGSERRIHYLPGGGLYVSNEVGTGQMYYVQSDYQGNWSSVTNATGTVLEHYSFDPWGRRRNHTDWSFNNVPTTFLFDRGYTGHEMLDAFDLINMNGRVYDPVMARFLSLDNYVQTPNNSQGFNRYSYCLNNPLMYTDPDGNNPLLIAALVVGTITGTINVAVHWNKIDNFWDGAAAFGIGFGAGVIGTVTGGSGFLAAGGSAAGAGGFFAGAWGAGVGYTYSTALQSAGNTAYFQDPKLTMDQFALGLGFSMVTGGLIQGSNSIINGRNFWNGDLIARGRTPFSFINNPKPMTVAPLKRMQPIQKLEMKPYNALYNSPSEIELPEQLSHYSPNNPKSWSTLGFLPDQEVYLTPDPELSRVGALNDLAMPKMPNFRIDITGASLDGTKIELIRRVTGNVYGQGGGGWEIIYKGPLVINKSNIITITRLP